VNKSNPVYVVRPLNELIFNQLERRLVSGHFANICHGRKRDRYADKIEFFPLAISKLILLNRKRNRIAKASRRRNRAK